jgi:eukaryotic-like serine/threonine-protein kinase
MLAVPEPVSTHLPAWSPEELTVEATLGQGGMGVVRLAQQASMGRRVAVKQLRPEHRTPEAQQKLLQEAWAAGCLEHPFIVPVYALGCDEHGMPMMVLKHLDGTVWSELLTGPVLSGDDLDRHLQILE